jgi:hypothetical protein
MILIIAIAVSSILLGGFILLTLFEAKNGMRVLAPLRARLDARIGHVAGVVRKLDSGTFSDRLRVISAYLVHECVHAVLLAVRAFERLLTQTVRALREHRFQTPHVKNEEDKTEKIG